MGVTGMFLSRTIGKSYSCNGRRLGVTGVSGLFREGQDGAPSGHPLGCDEYVKRGAAKDGSGRFDVDDGGKPLRSCCI